jgi:hypothetical protein
MGNGTRRVVAHTCHALGCSTYVHERLLMCYTHWRMVPRPLQTQVYSTYRPGQEVDKQPSAAYLRAQHAAIRVVATQEGVAIPPWLEDAEWGTLPTSTPMAAPNTP